MCNDEQCKCYENHEPCSKFHIKKLLKKIEQKLTINTQQLKVQVKQKINSIVQCIQQEQKRILQDIQNNIKFINLMNNQKVFYDLFILSQKQKIKQFNSINLAKLWQCNYQNSNHPQITQELTKNYIAHMNLNQKLIQDKIQFTKKQFFKIITTIKQHTKSNKVDENVIAKELKTRKLKNQKRVLGSQEGKSIIKKKIHDYQLKQIHPNPFFPTLSPSSIVKTNDQLKNLAKFFTKKVKSISVVFKARQYNFSLPKYYQKCGHLTDTIIICQTINSKILGGYTPLSFNPTNLIQNQFACDPSVTSFIFSLTNNDKFQLKQKQKAIYRSFNKSCIKFGANNNLSIQDNADKYQNNQTGLYVKTYVNQKYKQNKQSYKMLNGNQNQCFMMKQWEVMKVQFQ